jgi:hypothetical protein
MEGEPPNRLLNWNAIQPIAEPERRPTWGLRASQLPVNAGSSAFACLSDIGYL